MKILQITNSFHPVVGGQEKVVLEISKGLASLGHEITILTTDYLSKNVLPEREVYGKIKIIRFPNKYWLAGYGYSPGGVKWVKENWENYDVVHCHGYNRHLPESAAIFLRDRVPVVFTPHGFIHTKKNLFFKKIHDFFIGRKLVSVDSFTGSTQIDLGEFKKIGGSGKNFKEIANGVDLSKFGKREVSEFKKKYNISGKNLLYVGRIHKSKGLQYVIKAIKDSVWNLLIIGPDNGYQETLKQDIKKFGVANQVKFLGKIGDEELINSYFASDAFILFSEWEGFGIVVVEAMAAGLPLVLSDRGPLPKFVNNNGKIVPFGNVETLKKELNLLSDKKKLNAMGRKSRLMAKKYDWEKIVKKYEKIYRKISKKS
tara:strand:- start:470 stop:1582 length:1113 start_codon:yes stop_codon:yes gene_type:complete